MPLHYDNNHYNRVCDDCYNILKNDDDDQPPPTPEKHPSKKKKDILQVCIPVFNCPFFQSRCMVWNVTDMSPQKVIEIYLECSI